MLFELTPELLSLQQKAHKFAQEKIKPIAAESEDERMFSFEIMKEMGELGFLGIIVPKEYGGQGQSYLSYLVALEEIAKADASHSAVMALHNSLFAYPVLTYGTEEQKKNICLESALRKNIVLLPCRNRMLVRMLLRFRLLLQKLTPIILSMELKFL